MTNETFYKQSDKDAVTLYYTCPFPSRGLENIDPSQIEPTGCEYLEWCCKLLCDHFCAIWREPHIVNLHGQVYVS